MSEQGSYVPPIYVPVGQSDLEDRAAPGDEVNPVQQQTKQDAMQWSSGICACFDDTPSCCLGLFCPCYLFGKNVEFLGSGTLAGSCMAHLLIYGLVNSLCCLSTDGILLTVPASMVACYARGYRQALRAKYNLQEAPCGDFATHLFCHLCAVCQEYREIRERTIRANSSDQLNAIVAAPSVQIMNGDRQREVIYE